MSSWWQPPPNQRTLVEEDGWESSCMDLGIEVPRMDEIRRGVEAVLCAQPDKGTQIRDNLWGITTQKWPDAPALVIYYDFNEHEVYLRAVGVADEDEAEAEDEVESDG